MDIEIEIVVAGLCYPISVTYCSLSSLRSVLIQSTRTRRVIEIDIGKREEEETRRGEEKENETM